MLTWLHLDERAAYLLAAVEPPVFEIAASLLGVYAKSSLYLTPVERSSRTEYPAQYVRGGSSSWRRLPVDYAYGDAFISCISTAVSSMWQSVVAVTSRLTVAPGTYAASKPSGKFSSDISVSNSATES